MKVKRILPMLLIAVLAFSLLSGCGASYNSKTASDTLVVGTPAMNGDFIGGFGNSSYDNYIKVITGGYCDTYYQTPEGQLKMDETVVKNLETSLDAAGNKTYTFTLHETQKWNNGNPITAKDYVAYLLQYASPAWSNAGAASNAGQGLVGYAAYKDGETDTFAGVRLLGEYVFSVTIDASRLPYFYEVSDAAVGPVPMDHYFPGNSIISDENGSRFANDISEDCNRIATTDRFAPVVTCGPYQFVSFDGTNVNLQRNPHFDGDWDGDKPTFEYIIQMAIPSETDVDMVLAGEVDLVTGVIEGAKIEAAKASEFADFNSYLRAGYGYLGFHCDWGPTADPNVRWAIAYMIDRNTVIDHVLSGYGGLVDSAYGMAQWTYVARESELKQRLTPIAFNLTKANDHLDMSEWRFESDGVTPFDREKANADGTYLRHNSNGEVLRIEHISASAEVGGAIEMETNKNAPLVGMKYEITQGEFNELLDHWYYGNQKGADRKYSAFNLAVNFTAVDDKWYSYHSDQFDTWQNSNKLSDPEIDRLTETMRRLDPTETERYADLWVDFQVRLQELMPTIPLYSNEYYDVFNSVVKEVPTSPYATWAQVVCKIEKNK